MEAQDMPGGAVSLTIADLWAFTRPRRTDLMRAAEFPRHLGLMNMLAGAAGYADFPHPKARAALIWPETRRPPFQGGLSFGSDRVQRLPTAT